jgi:hypothetical protein
LQRGVISILRLQHHARQSGIWKMSDKPGVTRGSTMITAEIGCLTLARV